MPSITVKNIPEDLYERLKQRAKANHRSINSEIIVCIEEVVRTQQVDLNEVPADTRRLSEKAKDYRAVEEDLSKSIVGGTKSDLVGDLKEAFYRLVAEVVEDLLLANAIRAGEGSEEVSKDDIFLILAGDA